MKHTHFSLFIIIMGITNIKAQVGVQTQNPLGVFHIDAGKDNPITGVPTTAQQANDVIVTPTGSMGIKTASPLTALEVNGPIMFKNGAMPTTINAGIITWNSLRVGVGEMELINYNGTGTGGFRFYSAPGFGATPSYGTNNVAFINSAGVYSNSDMRLKTNINAVQNGIDKVMAMRPVIYDVHTDRKMENGKISFGKEDKIIHSAGFLAQELVKIFPEAVEIPKDESKELFGVNYSAVVPVLTKAIQEQQKEIEILKTENKNLLERLNKLEQRLNEK